MARDLAAFNKFHAENPDVFRLFVRFTREAIAAGHKRYSAHAILHRIRWHTSVETRGDAFKINDHFAPMYSRLFMREFPQHDGVFETRDPSDPTVADAVPVGHDVPFAHPSYLNRDTNRQRPVLNPAAPVQSLEGRGMPNRETALLAAAEPSRRALLPAVDAPTSLPGSGASSPTPLHRVPDAMGSSPISREE
jgi:hypothetical protein